MTGYYDNDWFPECYYYIKAEFILKHQELIAQMSFEGKLKKAWLCVNVFELEPDLKILMKSI